MRVFSVVFFLLGIHGVVSFDIRREKPVTRTNDLTTKVSSNRRALSTQPVFESVVYDESATGLAVHTFTKDAYPGGNNNFYAVDWNGNQVLKFDDKFNFIRSWGTEGTDNGQFIKPSAIAVDKDHNVYVSEWSGRRVQKFNRDGMHLLTFNPPPNKSPFPSSPWNFGYIWMIKVGCNGNIEFSDQIGGINSRMLTYTKDGTLLSEQIYPRDRVTDWKRDSDGNINVIARQNGGNKIMRKFDINFDRTDNSFNLSGSGEDNSMAVDCHGNIYIAEGFNDKVSIYTEGGVAHNIPSFGSTGTGDGQFNYVTGILIDGPYAYVSDMRNFNVQKFNLHNGCVEGSGPFDLACPILSTTSDPTASPTSNPTTSPTSNPTTSPTSNPTSSPTSNPTSSPTSSSYPTDQGIIDINNYNIDNVTCVGKITKDTFLPSVTCSASKLVDTKAIMEMKQGNCTGTRLGTTENTHNDTITVMSGSVDNYINDANQAFVFCLVVQTFIGTDLITEGKTEGTVILTRDLSGEFSLELSMEAYTTEVTSLESVAGNSVSSIAYQCKNDYSEILNPTVKPQGSTLSVCIVTDQGSSVSLTDVSMEISPSTYGSFTATSIITSDEVNNAVLTQFDSLEDGSKVQVKTILVSKYFADPSNSIVVSGTANYNYSSERERSLRILQSIEDEDISPFVLKIELKANEAGIFRLSSSAAYNLFLVYNMSVLLTCLVTFFI